MFDTPVYFEPTFWHTGFLYSWTDVRPPKSGRQMFKCGCPPSTARRQLFRKRHFGIAKDKKAARDRCFFSCNRKFRGIPAAGISKRRFWNAGNVQILLILFSKWSKYDIMGANRLRHPWQGWEKRLQRRNFFMKNERFERYIYMGVTAILVLIAAVFVVFLFL